MSTLAARVDPRVVGARGPRGALATAALVALPVAVVLAALALGALRGERDALAHLATYVLPGVLLNTLVLVAAVAALAGVLGTALAWLVTAYEFPGRRTFAWLLLLPMALPAYVLAFVAVATLDFAGPVQTALRAAFGAGLRLPPVRSTGGVILVLTLALYPYVYLLARGAFATQGRRALEVAQSLGLGRRQAFTRVALPLARPWIAAGVALVAMETLADFGTVAVFNYDTFTTAIYRAWTGMYSIEAALQLSGALVLLVAVALVVEQRARAAQRHTALAGPDPVRHRLAGVRAAAACGAVGLVLLLALVLPLGTLLVWAAAHAGRDLGPALAGYAARSVVLGLLAAALVCSLGLLLGYAVRRRGDATTRGLARLATLGYALPGSVLAVGLFVPVAGLNSALADLAGALGLHWPFYLQGSLAVLLLAYAVRFLAVGHAPIESHLGRIRPSIDDSARLLGATAWRLARRVHLPLLRAGLVTAAALVFVDVMKEMPITLMTRPFGWDTLAVRVFELTSEGEWRRAALPALAIVAAGVLPVALLLRAGERDAP